MDKITLNVILRNIKQTQTEYKKNIDDTINNLEQTIKKKYPKKLQHYKLLPASELDTGLNTGNVIRYIKNQENQPLTISCASIIIKIVRSHNAIKYILLRTTNNKKNIWKLYPDNYFIFVRDKYRRNNELLDIGNKLLSKYNEGKISLENYNKLSQIDPKIKKKLIRPGMPDDPIDICNQIISENDHI